MCSSCWPALGLEVTSTSDWLSLTPEAVSYTDWSVSMPAAVPYTDWLLRQYPVLRRLPAVGDALKLVPKIQCQHFVHLLNCIIIINVFKRFN